MIDVRTHEFAMAVRALAYELIISINDYCFVVICIYRSYVAGGKRTNRADREPGYGTKMLVVSVPKR